MPAYHCDMLKPKVALITEVVGRLSLAHDDDVFNPDAKMPVLVVSRLWQ